MSDQRLARLMGPLGIATTVLIVIGFAVLTGNSPGENASGTSVVNYYNAHIGQAWSSIWVVGGALGFMTLYSVILRAKLREAGAGRLLSTTAFAGGIMFVSGVVASGIFHEALISAAHEHQASVASVLNFVDQNDQVAVLFGAIITTLATGAAILNRSSLPRWLGWVAVVIGVVMCLGDIGFFGFLAFGIWLPVAGFVIGRHEPDAAGASMPPRSAEPVTTG